MVTGATVDGSGVRSAGEYRLSAVVFLATCLQDAVEAATPQFVPSGSAPCAVRCPLCCTAVVASCPAHASGRAEVAVESSVR